MKTPELRRAVPSDLTAVERLLAESSLPLDGVAGALGDFMVAQADDEIVGVAGLEVCGDNALLRSVAVAPRWRSHGIARALVTHVISDAEARGLHALYLLTTTAEQYFPIFGFKKIERAAVPDDVRQTDEFRFACSVTATVMCRECK